MNKPSVYIETSVVSYLTSKPSGLLVVAANQQITREWWEKALPHYDAYVSEVAVAEASDGDAAAARDRLERLAGIPLLPMTPEVRQIARTYHREISLPERAAADSVHLALASWHNVDFVVSWNCKHIVNGQVIKKLRRINERLGIETPVICTPVELLEEWHDPRSDC